MIRLAVAAAKHNPGWPFGLYLKIGLSCGILGATGEAWHVPPNLVGVAVVLVAAAGTTYLLARSTSAAGDKARSKAVGA